ncbi:hypothetical protein ACE6H2_012507 [Prunus campanulata]
MLLATLDLACLELKTFTFLSLVDCGFDYAVKVAAGVSLADTEAAAPASAPTPSPAPAAAPTPSPVRLCQSYCRKPLCRSI